MARRQTVSSAAALNKLVTLDQEAETFDSDFASFKSSLNAKDRTLDTLLHARNAARQWSGNLEKFQYVKVR